MTYDNKFNVLSLADNQRHFKRGLSAAPLAIITGGYKIVQEILGLFGQSRRLEAADWEKLFPANGYWTDKLKNYLSKHIHWDSDLKNIAPYTSYFVRENLYEITGGKYPNLATVPQSDYLEILNGFYGMLQSEAEGNNVQTASFFNSSSLTPLLIGGVVLGLVLSSKGKKR